MESSSVTTPLIGLLLAVGGVVVYQMARQQSKQLAAYQLVARKLKAAYIGTSARPEGMDGSVLATREIVGSNTMKSEPATEAAWWFTNAAISRPDQDTAELYGLVVLAASREYPHILIQPQKSGFWHRIEADNEANLQPAELESTATEVFVAAGYETESLQVLTPALLEQVAATQLVIECFGHTVIVLHKGVVAPAQVEALVAAAGQIRDGLHGLGHITPIGDLSLTLRASRSGEFAVAWGRPLGIIVAVLAAVGVVLVGVWLLAYR